MEKKPSDDLTIWFRLLLLLAVLGSLLRFTGLNESPPGFYVDEAAISAQVICVRQSGADFYGQRWPVFSAVLGGGYVTPVFLYAGAIWSAVFGDSIVSFRAFAAFFGALAVLGVYLLARKLWGKREAALAALAAAISPWAFQFSRIAWDPALVAALLIWGLYFCFRGGKRPVIEGATGGLLLSLAMHTYPPARATIALLIPALVAVLIHTLHAPARRVVALIATLALVSSPMIFWLIKPEFRARFEMLSIFNEGFLRTRGEPSLWLGLQVFFENLAAHFSPRYLFFAGDGNLRHSTQGVGQWSWLDISALAALPVLVVNRSLIATRRDLVFLLLLPFGYLAAVTPAALTWESNPHALRSIAAWPFLALLTGYLLARLTRVVSSTAPAIVFIAAVFMMWFGYDFGVRYPERSAQWFDQSIAAKAAELARNGEMSRFAEEAKLAISDYPDLAIAYFELREGVRRCGSDQ